MKQIPLLLNKKSYHVYYSFGKNYINDQTLKTVLVPSSEGLLWQNCYLVCVKTILDNLIEITGIIYKLSFGVFHLICHITIFWRVPGMGLYNLF